MKIKDSIENFKASYLIIKEVEHLFYSLSNAQRNIFQTIFYSVKFIDYPDYFFSQSHGKSLRSIKPKIEIQLEFEKATISSDWLSTDIIEKDGKIKVIPSILTLPQVNRFQSFSVDVKNVINNTKNLYYHSHELSQNTFKEESVQFFIEKIIPNQDCASLLLPTLSQKAIESILTRLPFLFELSSFETLENNLSPLTSRVHQEHKRQYPLGNFGSVMQKFRESSLDNDYIKAYYEQKKLESTIIDKSNEQNLGEKIHKKHKI